MIKKDKYWVIPLAEFDTIMQLLQTHPSYRTAVESSAIANIFSVVNNAAVEYQKTNQQEVSPHAPITRTYEKNRAAEHGRQPVRQNLMKPSEEVEADEDEIDQSELEEEQQPDEEEEAPADEEEDEEPPAPPVPPKRTAPVVEQRRPLTPAEQRKSVPLTPWQKTWAKPTKAQMAKPVMKKKNKIEEEEGDSQQSDTVDENDELLDGFSDSDF